jgi:hypothetical protein
MVEPRQLLAHVELRKRVGGDPKRHLVEWDGCILEVDELGEPLGLLGLSIGHRITL